MGSKFMAHAGFICNKAPITMVVLREKDWRYTLCNNYTSQKLSCIWHSYQIKYLKYFWTNNLQNCGVIFIISFSNIPVKTNGTTYL